MQISIDHLSKHDTDLIDNVSHYTDGQLGLFHIKIAGDRVVTNEVWGKPNSKCPWSLWKLNALLRCKAITVGWKSKMLPPFRPSYKLILKLALLAHILDVFHIHCPHESLATWILVVKTCDKILAVAKKIQTNLCSARCVSQLHCKPLIQRDMPLQNIILFNHASILLCEIAYGIKQGDVGQVINILVYWMVMFRGTGKMLKYADTLFHLLVSLKHMNPRMW